MGFGVVFFGILGGLGGVWGFKVWGASWKGRGRKSFGLEASLTVLLSLALKV